MTTPELIDYIRTQLATGQGKETISQTLQAQGWTAGDVEEAFNMIKAVSSPVQPQPVRPIQPSQPVQVAQPIQQPTQPIQQPAQPLAPVQSQAVQPTQSFRPVQPTQSFQQAQPTAQPAQPIIRQTPTAQFQPAQPAQPVQPNFQSANSFQSNVRPVNPVQQFNPAQSQSFAPPVMGNNGFVKPQAFAQTAAPVAATAKAGSSLWMIISIIIVVLAIIAGGGYYFFFMANQTPLDWQVKNTNTFENNQNNLSIVNTIPAELASSTSSQQATTTGSVSGTILVADNNSNLACDKVFPDDIINNSLGSGLSRVTNSATPGANELLFCSYNYTDNQENIYVTALTVYPNSAQYEPSLALIKAGVGGVYTPKCEPSNIGFKSSLCTVDGTVPQILFVTSNNKYTAIVSLGSLYDSKLNLSEVVGKMAKAVDSRLK